VRSRNLNPFAGHANKGPVLREPLLSPTHSAHFVTWSLGTSFAAEPSKTAAMSMKHGWPAFSGLRIDDEHLHVRRSMMPGHTTLGDRWFGKPS
jgi:hypothetical protein